jgi:hypothetical protein
VIATQVDGLPELVVHNKTGMIVQPRDPKGLALAVETLLADEEKRRQYGLTGKKFLETELAWDRVTQALVKIYAESWTGSQLQVDGSQDGSNDCRAPSKKISEGDPDRHMAEIFVGRASKEDGLSLERGEELTGE